MNTIKRFVSYYRPYKKALAMDLLCASTVSGIDLIIPLLINYLIYTVLVQSDLDLMLRLLIQASLGLFVLYIIRMFAQYYVTSWGHIMGARMEADMRDQLFSHYEKLSFSYYDKNPTGKMMSRLIADLFDISELAHHGPEDIFISTVKLTGAFIILGSINLQVTLALLGVTVLMGAFALFYNRRMRRVFMENRKKIADVNAVVQDSLAGIRTVQSFANEHVEQNKFHEGNSRFLETKKNSYLTMGRYFATNTMMQGMMYLTVLGVGGLLVIRSGMEAESIILYILYINTFLDPVNRLINFTEQFLKGLTGFERMAEVLDTEPEIEDREGAVDAGVLKGEIEFSDVSFSYGDGEMVLDSISLTVSHGKTIALVGPSGAGKTTFCSLIPRFYEVTGGCIKIDGTDIRDYTLKSLRENIGIVQQDVYMFDSTIRENIAYGKPNATEEEIITAAKRANIHDFIISLPEGYDTLTGERGVRFSGGQKQRLSIARVFLKNPPILIFDEATSALDNESERYIQQAMQELAEERTTFVIAHRLSTIRHADEIIVLTEQGLHERGNHDELMSANGVYAGLYNMQFGA